MQNVLVIYYSVTNYPKAKQFNKANVSSLTL